MTDLSDRIDALTPEQRAVFELLRKKSAPKKPAQGVAPPILRRPEAGPAPLSFDQERLWFLGQLDPESSAYNIDTAIRMKGTLDVAVLRAALAEIVRRHEAWRTVFSAVDGRPAQVVLAELVLDVPVVDLRELPAAEREAAGLAMAIEEACTPMDLARGPLVRVRLLRLADDEHICLMTVHHIVSDWVSFTLAWMEIAALYPAFLAGEPSPLPEPPVQYADFAVWQRSWLAGETLENAIDFWTKELAGFPHVLELPTDRPRPAAQTTRGGRARVALPPARAEAFRALARKQGVTPFIAMLAAFDALLCRWSGQEKILVGSPNANRNRPEIESLLGFFVSQLVFAADVSGDPPFREILARARKTALAAYAHQELPFGKLVEALRLERDASRPPLAQVNLLLLDTASSSTIELPSLTFSGVDVDDGSSPFETTLMLFDGAASGVHGWFEYNLDLWDGTTTIARLAEAFEILVERVSADPEVRLAEIPLLGEGAVQQILREWNDTAVGGDRRSADRLFEERAAERPDAPALVVAPDLAVTYGELDRAANRLAQYLRRLGIGRESRVGLRTGRGPEMLVGLLGIWKAGGAYVPLDPGYPEERLALLLEDAGIEVVVTEAKLPGGLPVERVRTVALEGIASLAGEPETRPEGETEPGDLAYVIYTSGTTGKPKGVMAEHGNLANTLLGSRLEFEWSRGDRIPALAPFSFDIFLFEVMNPLISGGAVELVPLVPALDLDRLMTALPLATRLHAVPALMRQICALVRAGVARPAGLKTLFVGGDAVPPDLLAEMREAFPGAEIRVLYGPTEGTVICASFAVSAEADSVNRAMLGRPLANVDLRLYDRQGGLALVGAPGELWIGGPGVTRGYLNREELTAEKFVTRDGRRWYRTGDLARRLADGTLEFAGRVDQQVKVRGFRVEPGEIEARLAAHPAVREAVVLARVEGGDKRLAAYVVAEGGVGEEALRVWVGEALPEYMVPSLVVVLPELPVTAHGKVDRKALLTLEAPRNGGPAPVADRTLPRTPAEEILAGIWRDVLRVDEVGVQDNFFRLGGDSILSIQVVARARQAGLGLTPRQMFESQTIAALAAVAVSAGQEEGQGAVEGEAPLTPIQLRFFAEERPEPGWFNQTLVFEVREALDPVRLRQAVVALVEHHDALRLRFLKEDGRWRQVHAPVEETPFTWIDGPALSEVRELQAGFDLAAGPLFRAVLLTDASGAQQLLFAAHHLIVDGVSWRILLEDLATAYAGPPLPAKTTSWKRWAERLAAYARSAEVLAELPLWRAEPESGPLPVDRHSGPNTVASSFQVDSSLDVETTEALLKRAPEAYRTEINDLLLAALARTLAAWTGAGRHRIELEGHGREEVVPGVDLSRTVGWFTTVFPVVLDVEGRPGPGEAIRAVKETLRAIPNRGIGYGLLRYLSPEKESLASIFDPEIGFNYLGRVDGAVPGSLAPADEPTGPAESPRASRRHLLDVDAVVHGGRLRVTWTASRNRHDEATVERLAHAFLAEVETLVAHCLSPEAGGYTPSDFPLARLDPVTVDAVLGRDQAVEDVYPLAPLQRGMLFHTLYASGSEIYFEQLAATLRGNLDVNAFGRAFQATVDREPVLRTAFLWERLPEPLQVVRRGVEMPWVLEDWRGMPAGEAEGRFAAYAAADRARGFDLGRPPLQRVALLRTGEQEHRLLWSFHHLLFDGWCFSLLFREIFTFYAAWRGEGEAELGPVHPYRDYIAWLQKRDLGQAEAWWRERLSGFTAATPLPFEAEEREGRAAADYEEQGIVLASPLAASLQAFAQREGLTLNTLVQGAWALLLSRMSGARDVIFGAVVAGRPAELPGVEEMVGLFINTLPVRVEVDPGAPVTAWLRDLQARQVEMRSWEWSPLSDVQRWSGVPPGEPLFHSLLVFENYPIDPSVGSRLPELAIDAVEVSERTNYPLTLTAVVRGEFLIRASFDRRLAAPTVERMLGHLEALLAALAADPGRGLGDLPAVPDLVARELPRSPAAVPEGAATAPRTAVEEALSRVWRAVLLLDRVGVHDDFFRLGGDSILSLQIVVKAREEGLHVTPKQLFENPTIATLAVVATPLSERIVEAGATEGEAPLTPIQRFFLASGGPEPHWFNQALLLEVRQKTAPAVLARATAALLAAHGALRLRFRREDGAWRSAVAPASGEALFLAVDLSALPPEVRSRAVETASAQLQTGFDLARGPLFLAALFDPGRLLLAAHHLVVDAVSWRVLLEDLETSCRQIEAGEPVRLASPTLSWRGWAERLAEHARSAEVLAELPLWLDAPAVRPLPVDFPVGENTAGSAASVSLAFPAEITEALLREAPRAYNTRVDDLLLTALAAAFARWTGEPRLRLDLEAHGREEITSGIDLSRTVGWFTAVHPVTLDLAGTDGPGEAILAVKERLRAVPRRGIGYGLLRWLGDDESRELLTALPEPEIAFNNLGQLDQALGDGGRFVPAPEPTGPSQNPRARRSHLLEVSALILDHRLRVDWSYSAGLHAPETIERLAGDFREVLESLIAHCLSPEAGRATPSDFPLARLDQATLDAALGADRSIEDLYPLAPLQKGMLLHGIWAPESPLYLEQLYCDLVGDLDVSAFTRAWQRVVDRHAALRTAFVWRGLPEPLQIVRREVELPWTLEDFRDFPAPDERVRAWIAEDASRVFDLTRPPLLRTALLRTGEDRVRFVWTFHHLLFDGWCFALLFREVFAFYEAFRRGEDLRLPEPRPYRDYIAWLGRRRTGEAEAYWRGVLAGFESPTPLPLDAPGAPPPAHPVAREGELVLSPASTAVLEAFAQGRRLTVNTLVQAAWGLLLSRMADRRDVVFGTVVSGRPPELPGVESMVGLFINTLPVRMDVDLAAPVAAWLRAVQEDQVEMRQHEWSPLADVQAWSGLPPGEPLFHSLLAFENYPVDDSLGEGAGDLAVHGLVVSDRTDYPLSLAAIPGGTGLAFRLAYDHRTDASTVQRLLGHLETLLAGLAAHPERLLGEVPILTEPERGQLLAWSTGERAPLEETCLHELLEIQAGQTPDAVALVDEDGQTTYAELDRRANRLANTLRDLGVAPEVRVGLCVSRSAEMVTAILGILKAGGAYVPVDPETPSDRLAFLLADAPVVVTESSFPLPPIRGRTLLLDDPSWLAAPPTRPASGVTPENLAYVIYTSGSTGLPKGVMVRHRSAVTYARAIGSAYGLGPGDRALEFASISFDASVEEIFTALGTGAALVVRTGVDDVETFLARCRGWRLTHLSLPTAYWHQIAAALEFEGAELHPELRLVVMGGERALPDRWAAWGKGLGVRARLVNSYGPTEATIAATIHEHRGTEEAPGREVPIGRPLPGVGTHVLGRDLRLVPVGALGELCLGGGCLARGYLNRPDLTAEKFVPDPFGEAGARLYRTGDLVRRLPDGTLEFAGRVDAQVKIRGFRIELGEVEAALSAHPGVKEAVATTRKDASGSHRLVAFAVPLVPGDPLSGLRSFLAGRLPAYMVPSDLGVLDALPVTPAGKLDRRVLDAIGITRGPEAGFVAPGNPVEESLAAIWSELLGVERVGVDDDFFALGGHSLLATQLVSRMRRQLGVEIPLHQLFELRTLGDLAREVLARTFAEADGMESLMAELDGLSDEEALALLGEEGA